MTVHSPHLEIEYAGLHDDCERCGELADHPDQLDVLNFARLRRGDHFTALDRRAAGNLELWVQSQPRPAR